MIKHIVVPVDGSAHARQAVDMASDLAKQLSAELTLIHVMSRIGSDRVPPELKQYAEMEHITINEHELLESVAKSILSEARYQAQQQGVNRVTTALQEGNPAHQIVEYAKSHDADLIVMGSRGLNDLSGLLLGSVSHKVSHLAPVACMLVK